MIIEMSKLQRKEYPAQYYLRAIESLHENILQ